MMLQSCPTSPSRCLTPAWSSSWDQRMLQDLHSAQRSSHAELLLARQTPRHLISKREDRGSFHSDAAPSFFNARPHPPTQTNLRSSSAVRRAPRAPPLSAHANVNPGWDSDRQVAQSPALARASDCRITVSETAATTRRAHSASVSDLAQRTGCHRSASNTNSVHAGPLRLGSETEAPSRHAIAGMSATRRVWGRTSSSGGPICSSSSPCAGFSRQGSSLRGPGVP